MTAFLTAMSLLCRFCIRTRRGDTGIIQKNKNKQANVNRARKKDIKIYSLPELPYAPGQAGSCRSGLAGGRHARYKNTGRPEQLFAYHVAFLELVDNRVVVLVRMFLLGHGFVDFGVKRFSD